MQLQFSPSMRSITISSSGNGIGGANGGYGSGAGDVMKIKVAPRHMSYRTVFHTVLILAFLLPFFFILTALVTLEGVNKCSSLDCLGRRLGPKLLGRADDSGQRLVKDFVKILNQVNNEEVPSKLKLPESYRQLVSETKNNKYPAKEFAFILKGMMERAEREIREAKFAELMNKHFAASSIPKGLHCLSLRLTDEYSSNAHARKQLPSPELLPLLSDNSYLHLVLSTDNILAASVVVNSAVQSSLKPEKIVFHVITDKKTYAGMHSWFALNPISPAIIEVKGIHHFDWLTWENVPVLEAVENENVIQKYYGNHIAGANLSDTTPRSFASKLQARSPKYISLLNHIRIYLPEQQYDANGSLVHPPGVDPNPAVAYANASAYLDAQQLAYYYAAYPQAVASGPAATAAYYQDPNAVHLAYSQYSNVVASGPAATAAYYQDPNAAYLAFNPYSNGAVMQPSVTQRSANPNSGLRGKRNVGVRKTNNTLMKKRPKIAKVVQSAWCEVCKVDCNSGDVLDKHKEGKKHKKNIEKLIAASKPAPPPPPPPPPQVVAPPVSSTSDGSAATCNNNNSIIGPQENPSKGGKSSGSKKGKRRAADMEDLETKKKKMLEGGADAEAVRWCDVCSVVCNSETVFRYHLAGQKHAFMEKRHAIKMRRLAAPKPKPPPPAAAAATITTTTNAEPSAVTNAEDTATTNAETNATTTNAETSATTSAATA